MLEADIVVVPIEETVRAFNWVIEKGWVCGLSKPHVSLKLTLIRRHSTGERPSGR